MGKVNKKNRYETLGDQITLLKQSGAFPYYWKSGRELCLFLASLHPLLIFADGVVVHNLFGNQYRKRKGALVEIRRYVISAEDAKALVESSEFVAEKQRILKEDFGELRKKNADMAEMLIHYKILEGDNEMAKVALQIGGRWSPSIKQIRENKVSNVEDIAKAAVKLIRVEETKKRIKLLDGNN